MVANAIVVCTRMKPEITFYNCVLNYATYICYCKYSCNIIHCYLQLIRII